jgi:hypothetical protein
VHVRASPTVDAGETAVPATDPDPEPEAEPKAGEEPVPVHKIHEDSNTGNDEDTDTNTGNDCRRVPPSSDPRLQQEAEKGAETEAEKEADKGAEAGVAFTDTDGDQMRFILTAEGAIHEHVNDRFEMEVRRLRFDIATGELHDARGVSTVPAEERGRVLAGLRRLFRRAAAAQLQLLITPEEEGFPCGFAIRRHGLLPLLPPPLLPPPLLFALLHGAGAGGCGPRRGRCGGRRRFRCGGGQAQSQPQQAEAESAPNTAREGAGAGAMGGAAAPAEGPVSQGHAYADDEQQRELDRLLQMAVEESLAVSAN